MENTAIYRIKVLSMPRTIKNLNVFKLKTYYSLPEASKLYSDVIFELDKQHYDFDKGKGLSIKFEISHIDLSIAEKYEVDIPVVPDRELQESVSLDINQQILKSKDSKTADILRNIEESIGDSWYWGGYEPLSDTSSKSSKKKFSLFKKRSEENMEESTGDAFIANEDDFVEDEESNESSVESNQSEFQNEVDKETTDTVESTQVCSPNEENESKQLTTFSPDFVEKSVSEKETVDQTVETPEMINLKDKSAYITLDHEQDIESLGNDILRPIDDAKSKGPQYIIDQLEYSPADNDFIRAEKQTFIEQNYTPEELDFIYAEYNQEKMNLLNYASDTLSYRYDEIMKSNHDDELKHQIDEAKANAQANFSDEMEHMLSEQRTMQATEFENLKTKQATERQELQSRHEEQLKEFESRARHEVQAEKDRIREECNLKKDAECQRIKAEYEAKEQKLKEEELQISRDNVKKQCIEKFKALKLDAQKAVMSFRNGWKERINDQQEVFQSSYDKHLEEEAKAKIEAEKAREEEKAERELRLKEEQVKLQNERNEDYKAENERLIATINQLSDDVKSQNQQQAENLTALQNRYADDLLNIKYQQLDHLNNDKENTQGSVSKKTLTKYFVGFAIGSILLAGGASIGTAKYFDYQQKQKEIELKEKQVKDKQSDQIDDLNKKLETLQNENNTLQNERNNALNKQKELEQKQKDEEAKHSEQDQNNQEDNASEGDVNES